MSLRTHGDRKYRTTQSLGDAAEWEALRVEHRRIASGIQNGLTSDCMELDGATECLHVFLPATLLDRSALTALAAHLIGTCTVERQRPPTRVPSLDDKRLKRVLDFVDARLAEDLSLDELAAEACLSPFHFLRLFRDATGLTPHRYVISRRIQAAQKRLADRRSSLMQIAFETGFSSQANFTRAFRKWTGFTPGQYRKLCS